MKPINKTYDKTKTLVPQRVSLIDTFCDELHSITLILPIDTKIYQKGACNYSMTKRNETRKAGRPTNRPSLETLKQDIQKPTTTVHSLALKYNVSESTVLRWLRKYNLSAKYLTYEKRYRRGDPRTPIKLEAKRDRLTYLYKKRCLTQEQIANQYGVSARTVSRWLKQLDIVSPNQKTKHTTLMIAKSHEAQLRRLYVQNCLTIQQTADLLGVHRVTVSRWLDLLEIDKVR